MFLSGNGACGPNEVVGLADNWISVFTSLRDCNADWITAGITLRSPDRPRFNLGRQLRVGRPFGRKPPATFNSAINARVGLRPSFELRPSLPLRCLGLDEMLGARARAILASSPNLFPLFWLRERAVWRAMRAKPSIKSQSLSI
jgi:hypothetical protein